MTVSIALDELLATGWTSLDSAGCSYDLCGRAYPTPARVQQEFGQSGFKLRIARSDRFDCFQASWREIGEQTDAGAVASTSEAEAAVYALAQLRRTLAVV